MPAPIWLTLPPAGDDTAEGHAVGTVEPQRAVVGHIANDGAGRAAVAQLQRARREVVPPV